MKNHNYIRRKSQKQEARTAKDFGGQVRIASGAIETMKGDVRTGITTSAFNVNDFLIENKFTDAPAYKLTVATWKKIEKEAFRENMRTPMMQIDVQDLQLVVMNFDDFIATGLRDKFENPGGAPEIYNSKSVALRGSTFRPMLEEEMNYYLPIRFPQENLHLVVMGYDDLKRILF